MTRFIISDEQAVELIFKALHYAVGGEVFIPKLPAFKITDLIEILKEKHQSSIKTEMIGLRPGEKIHELMVNRAEVSRAYEYKDMFVITSSIHDYHHIETAKYVKDGRALSEKDFHKYSSKNAVISKTAVKSLFEQMELL